MTVRITATSILALSLIFSCAKPPEAEKAEAGEVHTIKADPAGTSVPLDTASSTLTWIGTKITGQHTGNVQLKSGSIIIDGGHIVGGNFVADMTTIVDNDLEGEWKAKLEKHLRTGDFFQVEEFPEAKFEIAEVSGTGSEVTVKGNFTIRGITKGVTFPATIEMEGDKPVSAHANFNFNRKLWGIVYNGKVDDVISDMVNLDLKLKF